MRLRIGILFVLILLLTALGNSPASESSNFSVKENRKQDLERKYERFGRRAAGRDDFPVLNFPKMSTVEEAKEIVRPTQWIIGISHNGEQKAYPISVMGIHELANDKIGGLPITVCW